MKNKMQSTFLTGAVLIFALGPTSEFADAAPNANARDVLPSCQIDLPPQASETATTFVPCTVFVQFYGTETDDEIDRLLKGQGVQKRFRFKHGLVSVKITGAAQYRALRDDNRVQKIYPNHVVRAIARKNRPDTGTGGSGTTSGPITPEGVKRIGADRAINKGDGVSIAIVDTGISDPNNNLNLHDACFDAFAGGGNNSYSNNNTGACLDGNGHGTHVAGIAAANGESLFSVAPKAWVYSVRVLNNQGSGNEDGVIAGLNWVNEFADSTLNIVNMSLGRSGDPDSEKESPYYIAINALKNKGISVVVAAGNDSGADITSMVPAGFDNVIAVASSTATAGSNSCNRFDGVIPADTASYFTTDGKYIVISAPGGTREDISKRCTIKGIGIESLTPTGGTTQMSGTSMAAPHVAGALALRDSSSESDIDFLKSVTSGKDFLPYTNPSEVTDDAVKEGVLDLCIRESFCKE